MELGYRLRRDVWGRGLATEGSMEQLRRAFAEWAVSRVVALTLATNTPSRLVMEKCGMKWERDFICPESWWPGSTEIQRCAVRYRVEAQEFELERRAPARRESAVLPRAGQELGTPFQGEHEQNSGA